MNKAFETRLLVNNLPIDLNEFAHQYVTSIVICAVSTLKGGENVETLVYNMDGAQTGLTINGLPVPLSPFPRDALQGTFSGMASSLRGVNKIDSLRIEMEPVKTAK